MARRAFEGQPLSGFRLYNPHSLLLYSCLATNKFWCIHGNGGVTIIPSGAVPSEGNGMYESSRTVKPNKEGSEHSFGVHLDVKC